MNNLVYFLLGPVPGPFKGEKILRVVLGTSKTLYEIDLKETLRTGPWEIPHNFGTRPDSPPGSSLQQTTKDTGEERRERPPDLTG